MILNLKQGGSDTDPACEQLYAALTAKGVERSITTSTSGPASKFATADLIGIPWQILVGPRGLAEGKVEVKRRADGQRELHVGRPTRVARIERMKLCAAATVDATISRLETARIV